MTPPRQLGYRMPAEWEPHRGTWLSWPHKEASWPGKFGPVPAIFARMVRHLADSEEVHINVAGPAMEQDVRRAPVPMRAPTAATSSSTTTPPTTPGAATTGRSSCSARQGGGSEEAIVDWDYNAWGGKYPPYDLDDVVPTRIAEELGLPVFHPGIVMEGGSIDVNGRGTLLTTEACLLNPNRNPQLDRRAIEGYLRDYLGVTNILWLGDGIVGDDTDGHVDDLTRFVDPSDRRHRGGGRSGRRELRAAPGQPGAAQPHDRSGRPAAPSRHPADAAPAVPRRTAAAGQLRQLLHRQRGRAAADL